MRAGSAIRLIVVSAVAAACGTSSEPSHPPPPPPPPPVAATVRITAQSLLIRFADTVGFLVEARTAGDAVIAAPQVTWWSSAPGVVSVGATGRVAGVTTGAAIIHARVDSVEDSVTVTVPPHWVMQDAGYWHACALTDLGRAYCWGRNFKGQLGNGTAVPESLPVPVASDVAFTSIYLAPELSCGLTSAGVAWCWGDDDGSGVARTPAPLPGGVTFRQLALGEFLRCGLGTDSKLYCWDKSYGAVPVLLDGSRSYVDISVGGDGCAVAANGSAFCWGYNGQGQFGNGTFESSPTPVAALTGHTLARIVVGDAHTCGLEPAGAVFCSGVGDPYGSLGDGSTVPYTNTPVRVTPTPPLARVDASNHGTCGTTADGATYCWGSFMIVAFSPWHLNAPAFGRVTIGNGSGFGLDARGRLWAWGSNEEGQLGDGTRVRRDTPVQLRDP